jgi:hypothetical protein
VRAVHVIPSGDVAASVPNLTTAQNNEPLTQIEDQYGADGSVRVVQLMPSGDVVAEAE